MGKRVEIWQIRKKRDFDGGGYIHREGTEKQMREEWNEFYKEAMNEKLGLYRVVYELIDGNGDR